MLADQQPRLQADPFSARGCRVLPPCLCRPTLFYGGFALLPWLWLTNVWLFWPEFRQGSDPEIQKYTRRSAAGFSVMTVALLAWMLTYYIGGPSLLGDLWYKLDVTGVPLAEYGL